MSFGASLWKNCVVGAFGIWELQVKDYWSLLFLLPCGLFVVSSNIPDTLLGHFVLDICSSWNAVLLAPFMSLLHFHLSLHSNVISISRLSFFPTQFFSIALSIICYEIQLALEQLGLNCKDPLNMQVFQLTHTVQNPCSRVSSMVRNPHMRAADCVVKYFWLLGGHHP